MLEKQEKTRNCVRRNKEASRDFFYSMTKSTSGFSKSKFVFMGDLELGESSRCNFGRIGVLGASVHMRGAGID